MLERDALRAWLATLDHERLELCLTLRRDVLWGAPVHDLEDLADRLLHPASVAAVLHDLPAPALQTLEVLAAAGARASLDRAVELLDPSGSTDDPEHRDAVERAVGHLRATALVWPGTGNGLVVSPAALEMIWSPLGLGRPARALASVTGAAELQKLARRWGMDVPKRKADLVEAVCTQLADPVAVRRLVAAAPPAVADVLLDRARTLTQNLPKGAGRLAGLDQEEPEEIPDYLRSQAAYARYRVTATWAGENGLGFAPQFDPVELQIPAEVVLALAGPAFRAPFTPDPPVVLTAPVHEEHVRSSASAAVNEMLGSVMAVLELLTRAPVAVLRAGGVGAREITKAAKAVGCAPADVRIALECALWLQLLRTADGRLGTSSTFSTWRSQEPGRRAADLLRTWIAMPYLPTTDRDSDGRSLPALARLSPEVEFDANAARAVMLRHLKDLDDGLGVTSVAALAEAVAWRLPLRTGADPGRVAVVWAEAERLGVIAHGRLSAAGAALLDADDEETVVTELSGMLPRTQTRALVGSDLTVVVTGSPAPAVVDVLDAVAVREARGAASTWRLTPASVRGALDAGCTAEDVLETLRRLAGGDVPQAVGYLVRDVGRRHGHVRVQAAGAVLVSDDEALLAEVQAHRALRRLRLRRVAPTVLVAEAGPAETIAALRGAGYLPVEVDADGAPTVQLRRLPDVGGSSSARREEASAAPPGNAPAGTPEGLDDADDALRLWSAQLAGHEGGEPPTGDGRDPVPRRAPAVEEAAAAAKRLLTGGPVPVVDDVARLEQQIRTVSTRMSASEARQLAHAVVHREPVTIRYRSSSGGVTVRVVSDLTVQSGYLYGWCHLRRDDRYFALASILGVMAAPTGE